MARYTYGGRIEQLVVAADATMSGALKVAPGATLPALYDKPSSDGTRALVTDFLLDNNNDGTFETAATAIVADSAGYPPYFQGPDGLTSLYDLAGRRLKANDGDTGGVPSATTSVAGIAELATTTEATTGTDSTRITTPAGVKAVMDAHLGATVPHQIYSDAVDNLQTAMGSKADLSGGTVPLGQLPAADGTTPSTLALRRDTGTVTGNTASFDDELVPLLQTRALIAAGAASGADMRTLAIAAGSLPLAATGTSFITIPDLVVPDAASGQKWCCSLLGIYRSTAVAGIAFRHKTQAAAVTNVLANPSLETDVSSWNPNAPVTVARDTTAGGQDGSANMKATTVSAANHQILSEVHAAAPGSVWTAAAYCKLGAGTARTARVDIQFRDAAGVVLNSFLGTNTTPVSGSWTRATCNATSGVVAPTGTVDVRVRLTYLTPAIGDIVHWDAIQLEPSAPLPAYGATGGSGSSAQTIMGKWEGLILTTPGVEDYRRVTAIRYPTVSNLVAQFGALGATTDAWFEAEFDVTIGGTGLTGQRIEFEFADKTADGSNHAQILAMVATFARVI